jgi:hypothetical protein
VAEFSVSAEADRALLVAFLAHAAANAAMAVFDFIDD